MIVVEFEQVESNRSLTEQLVISLLKFFFFRFLRGSNHFFLLILYKNYDQFKLVLHNRKKLFSANIYF